jgi:mannose-6-phosphate isomerase class I
VKATIRELQTIPEAQFGVSHYIPQMLVRLSEQYSESDNGNLVATFLMNYITLKPGDAVCVPADSIHAYLEGDILECMARSDNVLNTGFCPTAERDNVELFTRTLTFKPHSAREAELPREKSEKGMEGKTDVYAPPISEFNVLATSLGAEEREAQGHSRTKSDDCYRGVWQDGYTWEVHEYRRRIHLLRRTERTIGIFDRERNDGSQSLCRVDERQRAYIATKFDFSTWHDRKM